MKFLPRLLLLSAIAALSALPSARAQIGVYANFSAAKLSSGSSDWIYGPGFGAYLDHGHFIFLSTGIDARGLILGTGSSTRFDAGYIGPRLAVRPHILPIKPYIEGLVGVGHYENDVNNSAPLVIPTGGSPEPSSTSTSATKFSYLAVGGIDYTLIPRVDWRIAEFSYGGLSILDSSIHPKTISTGIVIRLPGIF
jgi:hypothetical protein